MTEQWAAAIWRMSGYAGRGRRRAWWASHALDRGTTVALVQRTLGHANIATTSQYLHARPGDSSGRYLAE